MVESRVLALFLQVSSAGRQHCSYLQRKARRAVSETLLWKREREEKGSNSGPWASCCLNREFRAKHGQQPLSYLQGLAGPGMNLHFVTEGREAAGGQGHHWVLAEPTSQGPAGERLALVPRPCRPSPAHPPTCVWGLQPARNLQLLMSKQSTCW